MKKYVKTSLALFMLALLTACGNDNCHYREGVASLAVSANPSSISAVNGQSTITAIGTAQDNLPMPDGTIVTFITDLGAFDQGAQAVTTDGLARITFRANGQDGTAKIYARTGNTVSQSITVAIGITAVGTVQVIANPGSIDSGPHLVQLVATVYTKESLPLPGVGVVFSADNGTITNGSPQITNSNGQAKNSLKVLKNNTTSDIVITVTANVGSVSGTTQVTQSAPTR